MVRAATGVATRHLQIAREETLRQRLIARDERALVEPIDHATPWLLGVAENILRNTADAEEVVMERFGKCGTKARRSKTRASASCRGCCG